MPWKWVHKGVRESMAWFGGLGVFSLVSKRYVNEFFPYAFFVLGFLLRGFFVHGFKGWPKDVVSG